MTDKLNDKQRDGILARVPAGRLGSGADVAAAAVYLASDEAGLCHRPDTARQRRNGDDMMPFTAEPAGSWVGAAALVKAFEVW